MFTKIILFTRSLFVKNIGILFFMISFNMMSQNTITRIHTDWKGYWTSNGTTGVNNRPDTANNLLAFAWNGTTYSTGVDDANLTSRGVTFDPQKFRALKIQTLGLNTNMYFLQGSMIDGSATTATLVPALTGSTSTGAELASRLTDGTNGLTLGTGIANIRTGVSEFKIGTNNLNVPGIGDGIPDIIVTQVAEPGGDADIFKFVDAAGNIVGNQITVNFGSVPAVGTYSLDLFRADNGAVAFTPAATRDIRLLGIEASSFGINAGNAAQVDRFVVSFSGSSDCAFIAFNTKSLKIAELGLVKKATLSSCGKLNDVVTYTFEVTNTGEVPITDIRVTDPMPGLVITGNPIASLAPGVTATLTGTYTITAADVAAGRIVNSAKVTGTDPSFNIIEDISGQTNTDNIATVTILLNAPTVGTITNRTCNTLGTVVLNNLPATGTWTLERSPGLTTFTGSGASYTVTGLPVGNYTYRVTNSEGCKSVATSTIAITDQSATTWDGTAWSNGLPTASKNVTFAGSFPITADMYACSCTINSGVGINVPSGRTLTITNAVTVSGTGSLVFENNASLVQGPNVTVNTNSGNITYKRNTAPMRLYDYTYWSSPVSGFTLYSLSPDTVSNEYFSYNPTLGWSSISNGTATMTPGVGYILSAPQSYSNSYAIVYNANFIGVPNNGDVNVTPTATKWNLVGNPYPSSLDAREFIIANTVPGSETIEGSLYFWTHNTLPDNIVPAQANRYFYTSDDYAVYNLTGSVVTSKSATTEATPGTNAPSGNIASGQGFFLKALRNTPIKFKNNMRLGTINTQFFKTAKETTVQDRVWLNFTNPQGAFKQILVGYIEEATNGVDVRYDATSFNANAYIDFYNVNGTKKLSIQGRALPFEKSDVIPLGYKSTIAGEFTIAIDHAEGIFSGQQNVYLEDKVKEVIHDLSTGDYTFKTEAGTFAERFELRYRTTNKTTLGTDDFENTQKGLFVAVKNKVVKITSTVEPIKDVVIYDITGRLIYTKKKVAAAELQIQNLPVTNQLLLVKVTLENDQIETRKIIVQ